MPDADQPQELPARLLTDPEMINACRVRDFARVFRLVKTRAGIYPSMIARRCDLTPSRVGEVIAGHRQLLHMDVIERISDGLRIPGGMLGLARRPWETPQALAVTEREAPQVPEPEEHEVRFKRHDINVSKDSLSVNWYIRVTHPNGSKLYDGWWRGSENATWQEAVEEAKRGALLIPAPKKGIEA